MDRNVKYFKLSNERLNQDSIIKMTTKENSDSIILELNFVLYKSGNEYKKYLQCGTNLILSLEASFVNNEIQLKGGTGRIFEIMDFYISPNELFEFKSLGLFSYFTSYIIRELIGKHSIDSNINVVFTGGPQVEKDKGDSDTYNRMNFTRKLKTYRKLGFKLKKVCKNKYHLQATPVSRIKDIKLPKTIIFYEYALDLINDAKELIPFADEKVKKYHDYKINSFLNKETIMFDASINIKDIIGTSHKRYYKKTWIHALNNLRTIAYVENLKLFSDQFCSIDFYTTKEHYQAGDDSWRIKVFKNKHYIAEGNHRTIIAKFLNALDLIGDNIKGIKYVIIQDVDYKERIKYMSLIRWLMMYYPDYQINFDVRSNESPENIINVNTKEIYHKRTYRKLIGYSYTKEGNFMPNYKYFENLEDLTAHVKKELSKNKLMHNINYLMAKISKIFKKNKREDSFNDEEIY